MNPDSLSPRCPGLLTIALEDYFQVGAFENVIRTRHWTRFENRLERNTRTALDLLKISTSDYSDMAAMLDRQLKSGNETLQRMGMSAKDPALGQPIQPMVGEFKNGRGEFYDQELWKGRAVYVRFVWSEITPNSAHFEQSYSDDGGKTWEVNWICELTR